MLQKQDFELNFNTKFPNIIKVIGVGGAGCNAVQHMHRMGIHDVDFVICNTDAQVLATVPEGIKSVQLGAELTKGLGAGTEPEMGKKAAEESEKSIRQLLQDPTEMVFITAGMGGGTGTGAAPVIARIAREMKRLTVAVVTDPFEFEGDDKIEQAKAGIVELKKNCDTVLIIKNDRLAAMYGDMVIDRAYAEADNVLANAVKSIAELITRPGIINLDFADVKKVLGNAGQAVMGSSEADGEDRAKCAIEAALQSPLLENNDINGAKRLLVSIAYSDEKPEYKIKMSDQTTVTRFVQSQIKSKAKLFKHGFAIDRKLGSKVRVTIVAAGFDATYPEEVEEIVVEYPTVEAPKPISKPVANEPRIAEPRPAAAPPRQEPVAQSPRVAPRPAAVPQMSEAERMTKLVQKFVETDFSRQNLARPAYTRNGTKLFNDSQILISSNVRYNLKDIYDELKRENLIA